MIERLQLDLFSKALSGEMQDFSRLINLCYLLMSTASVDGAICEFGCYDGNSAALFASLKPDNKAVWLFDSFEGLSDPGQHDLNKAPFVKGAMRSNPEVVRRTFSDAGLNYDVLHIAPVEKLTEADMPEAISFAHVDVDLHAPTLHVLNLVWPKLSRGGIVVIDDARHASLPGVAKAVRNFVLHDFQNRRLRLPFGVHGIPSLHTWIQKPQ